MEEFSMDPAGDDSADSPPPVDAKKAVKGPAIGLIVCGALAFVSALQTVVSMAMMSSAANTVTEEQRAMYEENEMGWVADITESMASGSLAIVSIILAVGLGTLYLLGGLKMMKLQSLGLVKACCWIAIVPLSCCCASTAFGIWGVVALKKPGVAEAFES